MDHEDPHGPADWPCPSVLELSSASPSGLELTRHPGWSSPTRPPVLPGWSSSGLELTPGWSSPGLELPARERRIVTHSNHAIAGV